jgi:hypothetical protein
MKTKRVVVVALISFACVMAFRFIYARHLGALALEALNNKDITFDGNSLGLVALYPEHYQKFAANAELIRADLLRALADRDKFVAAHVVLTRHYDSTPGLTSVEWNNLVVSELDSPDAAFQQQLYIAEFWDARFFGRRLFRSNPVYVRAYKNSLRE